MKPNILSIVMIAALAAILPSCASSESASGGSGVKRYPLNTCIVTDNELGSMGEIITKTYGNQEVKFCCKPCVKKFEANQGKFLAKLPQ